MERQVSPSKREPSHSDQKDLLEFADFWQQTIPESYEQAEARSIMENLGFEESIIDELSPEDINEIQKHIIKSAKGKLSLWSIAHEISKKLVDNLMKKNKEDDEIRKLVQEVMGFDTYTIPRVSKEGSEGSKIAEDEASYYPDEAREAIKFHGDINFPAVSIFRLMEKVGKEKTIGYVRMIMEEWDKLQDKVELSAGDTKANLFVPTVIAVDDIRSMMLFLEDRPQEKYAGNMILVKGRLEMAVEDIRREERERLNVPLISSQAHDIKTDAQKILEIYSKEIDEFIQTAEDSFVKREAGKEKENNFKFAWIKAGSEVKDDVKKKVNKILTEDLNNDVPCKTEVDYFTSVDGYKKDMEEKSSFSDMVVLSFEKGLTDEQKLKELEKLRLLQDKSFINKLAKPMIAVEAARDNLDMEFLERGADFIIRVFSNERGKDLIRRVAEMKKEAYGEDTLEELREEKEEFYDEVSDFIPERQKVTADTENEIRILKDVIKECYKEEKIDILDAGCGYGRLSLPLAKEGHHVTGVDLSGNMLDMFRELLSKEDSDLNIDIKKDNLTELSLKDKSQDAVMFNWHVFCELRTEQAKFSALKETFRVLKDRGIVILDVPDRRKLKEFSNGYYVHKPEGKEVVYRGYIPTIDEINKWLYDCGFKKVRVKEWVTSNNYPKLSIVAEKS